MPRFPVTLLRIVVFLIIMLSSSAALPVRATQDTAPAALRVTMPAPTTLDPVQLSRFDPTTRDLVENLFVGLARFNPLTRQAEPMLAESWSVSDDGMTWTFTLRQDIQWVRVDPATQAVTAIRPIAAGDFVYAIQRACDPLRASPVTTNLMIIRGCLTVANAFPEVINDLFIAREMGVRATGPNTLQIDLMFPAGYFPTLLSMPELRPLARETASSDANWTAADTLLTSGPYALQSWTDSGMTLVQNPYWPDAVPGNIGRVDVSFTASATPSTVDFARLTADQTASFPEDQVYSAPNAPVTMLGFSYERGFVNSPAARRALSLAIDREALVNQFFAGQAQPYNQLTIPGMVASPDAVLSSFDPVLAKAALAEAGYLDCGNVPEKISVYVPDDDPVWTQAGQFIVQQWIQHLGCNPALFEISALPHATLIELSHANYDPEQITRAHIWLAAWSADYLDANAWLSDSLHCQYGYIRNGRECDNADQLLDQAALDTDPARRAGLYAQVEELFFGPDGTHPVAPLFVSDTWWFQPSWVSGVNGFGPARFDLWTIDTAAQLTS